nr:HAD-IA family hydrolase [Paraperlucidibaca baekdonensis]
MTTSKKVWRCCVVAKFDLVIFDWDGTLMDSVAQIVRSIQAAAGVLGVDAPSDEAAKDIIGLGLPEAMRVLFPSVTEAAREALRQHYANHFVSHSQGQTTPFAGAEAMLEQLKAGAVQLAVATGKSRKGLDRVLADTGWRHYFAATRCADETRSKPDPRMLKELLSELNVPVQRALMVGDTTYDLGMAEALGMASVGVTYGVHSAERLLKHQPLTLCDSVPALAKFLQHTIYQ